jgi:hypothetical protein
MAPWKRVDRPFGDLGRRLEDTPSGGIFVKESLLFLRINPQSKADFRNTLSVLENGNQPV